MGRGSFVIGIDQGGQSVRGRHVRRECPAFTTCICNILVSSREPPPPPRMGIQSTKTVTLARFFFSSSSPFSIPIDLSQDRPRSNSGRLPDVRICAGIDERRAARNTDGMPRSFSQLSRLIKKMRPRHGVSDFRECSLIPFVFFLVWTDLISSPTCQYPTFRPRPPGTYIFRLFFYFLLA